MPVDDRHDIHVQLICPFLDGTWKTLSTVHEQDDQIEIDGEIFHKPFVEKPVSAENHDVYIYFPSSAGGGSQRLFRKVGSMIKRL
jgi:hypothetical protein